ncbi:MAG: phosphoenolpyruvate--protein phosphotransferase [Acidobacteria bacterium RIFCSPLOWO2_12_FULL_67_14b]|nr:MAG: phosphoenolpyruvate--protein phosphotransferase [Acidobacteria bacterium RIFCSPLOWO2_12_FULL_67_14b]
MERLTGIGVSPGVVLGRAVVLTQRTEVMRFPIPPDRVEREVAALTRAQADSRQQLLDIRGRLDQGRGSELAALFDAQLLMLDDPMLVGRAEQIIRTERVNAAWAVHRAYEELYHVFMSMEDPYLRERENDVADVAGRLRLNLRHGAKGPKELLSQIDGPSVLIADELTASVAAQLDWSRVQAFATDAGSRTYHTAILARSLKVPAIVGLHDASIRIAAGTPVILDGTTGELIVAPSADQIDEAHRRASRPRKRGLSSAESGPVSTTDGVRIRLEANIELLEDLPFLNEHGAEGVGLYRSEFMLSGKSIEAATEDKQYALYRSLIEQVAPRPVTIRTFDLDERQFGPTHGPERRRTRPGLRGLRLGLANPEVLRTQLRALVRASAHGPLRIMFPFVTAVEEVREARALLSVAMRDLGVDASGRIKVGAMIEVPSAALAADLLAPHVDFFTIGTNDLIQFCLAVDRTDDRVSDLYEPLHPAVLRLIRQVRRAAARQKIPVSLCGEMASDPALVGLLVGLGLTEFSMTPGAIPIVRQVIQELSAADARKLAGHALLLPTAAEIEQYLFDALAASAVQRSPSP